MDVPHGFRPFEPQGPFLEHIGPVHVREEGEERVFGLRAEERHCNHRGTIQGGLLSTFADFVLGRAIGAGADDGKDRATVSLTVDFLRPASPGDWIEARVDIQRLGRRVCFANCDIWHGADRIAHAAGAFLVVE